MPRVSLPAKAFNDCYRPYLWDDRRTQIFFGGAASGKSAFVASRVLLDALRGRNTLVVRAVARTLRGSCWNEILKAADRLNLRRFLIVGKSESVIACPGGGQILFCGLDDVEKIKSITPARGALTDIWIEEATETRYEDFKQLQKRLRGLSPHPKRVTLTFNPVYRTHWLYREFFPRWDESRTLLSERDLLILKTTYKNNRFLTDSDRLALENETDPYYRAVYTMGDWGAVGDTIFRNFSVRELDERTLGHPRYGLDFGFSSDPCGVVRAFLDRGGRRVLVTAEICEKGLTNQRLAQLLIPFAGNRAVVCDSAEPKSIEELRALGVRAVPAHKGPDSVMHGLQWLREREIVLSPACEKLREELSLYQWRRDKDGNPLREPRDQFNHLIDALRYALEDDMSSRKAETVDRSALGL